MLPHPRADAPARPPEASAERNLRIWTGEVGSHGLEPLIFAMFNSLSTDEKHRLIRENAAFPADSPDSSRRFAAREVYR